MKWVPLLAGGVLAAGLGVVLAATNLARADQWASVFGLFVAVAGLTLSGYALMPARRRGATGQRVSGSAVGGSVTQVRDVGGSVRIGGPAGGSAPAGRPPARPAPAGTGDEGQSVTDSGIAGPVHQVERVDGDTEVDR